MSVAQIAGLMLYSAPQAIPAVQKGPGAATYNGKPFAETGLHASELVQIGEKKIFNLDNLGNMLVSRVQSPE